MKKSLLCCIFVSVVFTTASAMDIARFPVVPQSQLTTHSLAGRRSLSDSFDVVKDVSVLNKCVANVDLLFQKQAIQRQELEIIMKTILSKLSSLQHKLSMVRRSDSGNAALFEQPGSVADSFSELCLNFRLLTERLPLEGMVKESIIGQIDALILTS